MIKIPAQSKPSLVTVKNAFFVMFWTIVLAPFEYYYVKLPLLSVVLIRTVAVFSNLLWLKIWFEKNIWTSSAFIVRVCRMITTKFFVNMTNFAVLLCITHLISYWGYKTGLHFTVTGFFTKVLFVTAFAVILTWPYEKLLLFFDFEENKIADVGYASDI